MRRKLTALVICGLMATSSLSFPPPANAQADAIVGAVAAGIANSYAFGGQNYCFYPNGWRGPGWYWCGYAFRSGLGWGGPVGWHGWRRPGFGGRPGFRPGRPGFRPGIARPGFRGGRVGGGHVGGGHGHGRR